MQISRPGICFDSYGARLAGFRLPDGNGGAVDVVLGPMRLEEVLLDRAAMGAVVGRYAGRIDGARFSIDGSLFILNANEGANLLHGGAEGFALRDWTVARGDAGEDTLQFGLVSRDGDQGFPGELAAEVLYSWKAGEWLEVAFAARASWPTPCNLTQHIYWNLAGPDEARVSEHWLRINAAAFLPVRGDMVPTGEIRPVAGTPFDLNGGRRLSDLLAASDPQIAIATGIDHCWALGGTGFREVAELTHPRSGRRMTVWTDQPGLQVYTANHFGEGPAGKGGAPYRRHAGIALETQNFPDAPNRPNFPDAILRPGETYRSRTRFVFDQP